MPNTEKCTLLRALTSGRAKTFNTLNSVVGVIRVVNSGFFGGWRGKGVVHDETQIEGKRHLELMEQGAFADSLTPNQKSTGTGDDTTHSS